jgi:hypothetical protein
MLDKTWRIGPGCARKLDVRSGVSSLFHGRVPRKRCRLACIAVAAAAGLAVASAGPSVRADGVSIGGSVTIKSSTGTVTNRAVGDGAKASKCAGAIAGSDVQIDGDVDIQHTGGAQGCTCVGAGCEAGPAGTHEKTTEDGDSAR